MFFDKLIDTAVSTDPAWPQAKRKEVRRHDGGLSVLRSGQVIRAITVASNPMRAFYAPAALGAMTAQAICNPCYGLPLTCGGTCGARE